MPIPSIPLFVAAQLHAKRDPEKVAIIDATKKESFTFTQLLEDAAGLRKRITDQLGLSDLEERRIAFLVPNGYDYVALSWGIWAAGGVCVPLCELLQVIIDMLPLATPGELTLTIDHQAPVIR